MKIVPSFLTFGLLSTCLLPAPSQPLSGPPLRVTVEWQKAVPSACGLTITGKIRNAGTQPLTYVQVVPLLSDRMGRVVYRGSGYLTVSPLAPGQSAEFRAFAADAPVFSRVSLTLRESGRPVTVREWKKTEQAERPVPAVPVSGDKVAAQPDPWLRR